MRDRQALYGQRHLLQAVAVKRLQAGGLALAEIQARLAGLPIDEVAAVADGRIVPTGRSARFWASRPAAQAAEAAAPPPAPPAALSPAVGTPDGPAEPADPRPLLAVPLGRGVTVLIAASRTLGTEEVADIRHAAAALLDHLTAAGLTGGEPKDRP